jgi:hypothetical protein
MAAAKNPNSRFIYSADAVAVAAVITSPQVFEQSWASAALPSIGGTVTSPQPTPVNITLAGKHILSFSSANTTITGKETLGGKVVTEATTTVNGLKILKDLTGLIDPDKGVIEAKVDLMVTSTFGNNPNKPTKVTVTNKPYNVLTVVTKIGDPGDDYSKVRLNEVRANKAGTNHSDFRDNDLPGIPNHHPLNPDKLEKVHLALADDANSPPLENDLAAKEFSFVDLKDAAGVVYGRVYFGGWIEEENRQIVTGLRVVLHTGDVKGEIVIADPGWNGGFYP